MSDYNVGFNMISRDENEANVRTFNHPSMRHLSQTCNTLPTLIFRQINKTIKKLRSERIVFEVEDNRNGYFKGDRKIFMRGSILMKKII